MANSGRTSSGRSSKGSKKSSSGKSARTTSRSASSRSTSRRTAAVQPEESGAKEAFKKFTASKASGPLIFIASVILLVGIDLLVSWDKYELFFKILGVEVLIAVFIWVILTLVFSSKKSDPDSEAYEDEV